MSQTNEPAAVPLSYAEHALDRFDRHDVATLALRLVGIYLLIQCLSLFPSLGLGLVFGQPWAVGGISIYFAGFTAFYGVCGILFLIYAPRWGRFLLPGGEAQMKSSPTGGDLQAVAFSVVGLCLAVWGVRDLITVASGGYPPPAYAAANHSWPYVAPAAQLAIGIALFLGARGLSAFWYRLRTTSYGRDNP